MDVIPKLSKIYDEPFSNSQIPTYLVSKLTKQHVKVALSGDGGDELFCGYNRYVMSKNYWNKISLLPISLRKLFSSGLRSISLQNWQRLSKFLPLSNQQTNLEDKISKSLNALNAKSLEELYYILRSNWHNPSEVVINTKK